MVPMYIFATGRYAEVTAERAAEIIAAGEGADLSRTTAIGLLHPDRRKGGGKRQHQHHVHSVDVPVEAPPVVESTPVKKARVVRRAKSAE